MREPSREAREAVEARFGPFAGTKALKQRDGIARALDDFAETVTQERDALRKELKQARTDAPHFCALDHQPIRHADGEHERCPLCRAIDERDALRRRVGELTEQTINDNETLDELISTLPCGHMRGGQMEDQHGLYCPTCRWKARSEAAEKALDEIIDMDPFEIHEQDVDPQQVAREARRARGKA